MALGLNVTCYRRGNIETRKLNKRIQNERGRNTYTDTVFIAKKKYYSSLVLFMYHSLTEFRPPLNSTPPRSLANVIIPYVLCPLMSR